MDYKPISGREFPRFSAIKTFFRLPHVDITEDYDIAVFGIPFDGGASYRSGARFAPTKVRELSSLGRSYHWSKETSVFEKHKVADVGDCPVVPIDLMQTYQKIESFADALLKLNKKILSVGGDHSTTLPLLRSLKKKYGKISLIHFDAHLDTYPAAWGCEYHHGSFVRHAVEENLVDPTQLIQIGIRGPLTGKDDLNFIHKHKIKVYTMDDIRDQSLAQFTSSLPIFDKYPTYISFDIDCLDPAYAPGTGTPVPGGLTSYEAQKILRALKIKNLVGADVVEICPAYDHGDITSILGAAIMFEILGII